mgnify:CR=1 FL=1
MKSSMQCFTVFPSRQHWDGGEGAMFMQMNRNKKGMTLNPTKEGSDEIVKKLVESADVVVANLPPQTLKRMGIDYETIFACDMDKFARQTFIENYGEPKYYPENVYDREIPKESIDIYMTSPPCQAFSIAGKRKGESEKRGVLFYNSHEFIIKNKPRYFIFENVKGLLSDDNGRTFQRWIDYLSKSVNGQPVIFPHEESASLNISLVLVFPRLPVIPITIPFKDFLL